MPTRLGALTDLTQPNNPQRLVRTDWRQSRNEETLEAGLGNLSESLVLGTATNVWQIGLLIHETMKVS